MHPLDFLADFGGGAFLMNALPHVVSGATGRRFPSPFAKPSGQGQFSALVNMFWNLLNLVVANLLLCRLEHFDGADLAPTGAFALGLLVMGLRHALRFGGLNGGRGPDLT